MSPAVLVVLQPGASALVQDLGRPGLAASGVGPSGAADRASHLRANALAGNRPEAATLEIVAPGFACQAVADTVVALAGAPAAASIDGIAHPHDSAFTLRAGQTLRLGEAAWGLRTYLAVRGGLAVPPVLGSRAADVLSGLGPAPVRAGDELPIGADLAEEPWRAPAPAARPRLPLDVPLLPAPGLAWLRADCLATAAPFTVGAAGGRSALRLEGAPLAHAAGVGEFPPQGLVRGAVQVPPDGLPIVFLADHPVTGGYPVVGVVAGTHLDRLAQLRPGDALRLTQAGLDPGAAPDASAG